MTIIKLKKYYPYLSENITLEVSDEIAVTLSIGGNCCDSYKRRKRDHGECSMDSTPGFEANLSIFRVTRRSLWRIRSFKRLSMRLLTSFLQYNPGEYTLTMSWD